MTIRHPEKINKQVNPIQKKPHWIRVKAPVSNMFKQTSDIVKKNNLNKIIYDTFLAAYNRASKLGKNK